MHHPTPAAFLCMTQIEFGFCPRDADVEQTALFLKVGSFGLPQVSGRMPSSQPTIKTTGNSKPLAAWRVSKEIRAAQWIPGIDLRFERKGGENRSRSSPHSRATGCRSSRPALVSSPAPVPQLFHRRLQAAQPERRHPGPFTQGINQCRHPRMVEQPRMGVFLKRHAERWRASTTCLCLASVRYSTADVRKGDDPVFGVLGSTAINRKEAVSAQQRLRLIARRTRLGLLCPRSWSVIKLGVSAMTGVDFCSDPDGAMTWEERWTMLLSDR